jgi:glycosyltransferase involved in cell wall biosynthesis
VSLKNSCEPPVKWFSPLDARATEIARYSAQLLPGLAKYARVVAVEDGQGASYPDWWDASLPIPEPISGVAPLPIYHIGNNPAHLPIYEQSRREPGLVVLHDLSLADLARHISREHGDPDWWKRQLQRQYGEAVSGLIHRSENSAADYTEMMANFPLFLPFVEDALGVVVHSDHARQALLERLPGGAPVRRLELPGEASAAAPHRDYRARPLVFVFCGHVGPNRRLIEFFEAWGMAPEPAAFRLHLYGNIGNRGELLQYAGRHGVSDLVEIHGYVPDEELESALQSAHFAINLRWPTMGEASASQLRYWSVGLPSLVTDVGWYAELPDDTVCKISCSAETEDIATLMQDALAHPTEYQRLGQRGREYLVQHHQPRDYAQRLADFAGELIQRRLATVSVERDLVALVADMCEDEGDIGLFSPAIETAVATMGPEIYQQGERES